MKLYAWKLIKKSLKNVVVAGVNIMSAFDEYLDDVLNGIKDLAKNTLGGFENQAKEDAKDFIKKTEEDLQRWFNLLASRGITEQDFSDLVQAKRALADMRRVSVAGAGLARLERFRSGLIDLLVGKAFEVFL
jgi:hypothetical protein